jgi:competence CoiA-like predicted nuclease
LCIFWWSFWRRAYHTVFTLNKIRTYSVMFLNVNYEVYTAHTYSYLHRKHLNRLGEDKYQQLMSLSTYFIPDKIICFSNSLDFQFGKLNYMRVYQTIVMNTD